MEGEKHYFLRTLDKSPGKTLSSQFQNHLDMAQMERQLMLQKVLDGKQVGDYVLCLTSRYGDHSYDISVIFFKKITEKKGRKKEKEKLSFEEQRQIIINALIEEGLNPWEIDALSFAEVNENTRVRCSGQSLPTEFDKIVLECPGTEISFSSPDHADLYVAGNALEAAQIATKRSLKGAFKGALENLFPDLSAKEQNLLSKFAKKDNVYLSALAPEETKSAVEDIIGDHSAEFSSSIHQRLNIKKK